MRLAAIFVVAALALAALIRIEEKLTRLEQAMRPDGSVCQTMGCR